MEERLSCERKKRGELISSKSSLFDFFTSFSFFETRNEKLARILEQVVEIGLRAGWGEFQDTPLQLPKIQLPPHLRSSSSSSISPDQNPPLESEHNTNSSSSLPPLKDSQMDVSAGGGGAVGTESSSSSSES